MLKLPGATDPSKPQVRMDPMNSLVAASPARASHSSAYNLRDTRSPTPSSATPWASWWITSPASSPGSSASSPGRGYNIDSLTVAETDHASHLSRITIVTTGTPAVIEQIKAQLGRLVPVHDGPRPHRRGSAAPRTRAGAGQGGVFQGRINGSRRCAWPRSDRRPGGRRDAGIASSSKSPATTEEIDAFIDADGAPWA